MSFPMSSMCRRRRCDRFPLGRPVRRASRRGRPETREGTIATALDPQGDGSTIHWENPKTSHEGSITPVGHAYTADGQVCRAFIGDLVHDKGHRTVQGTACTIAAGQWAAKDMKPFKKV
jgi:hypothetical protein